MHALFLQIVVYLIPVYMSRCLYQSAGYFSPFRGGQVIPDISYQRKTDVAAPKQKSVSNGIWFFHRPFKGKLTFAIDCNGEKNCILSIISEQRLPGGRFIVVDETSYGS